MREAAEEYLSSLKRLRPATREGYEHCLEQFCTWCESQQPAIQLEQVRGKVVDSFLEHLQVALSSRKLERKQVSTYTLRNYVAAILAFLHWCLEDEEYSQYVKAATVRRIKKPRLEQTIIETFSKEQLEALFRACRQECNAHLQLRDRAILSLLIDTGIRASELCELTIGNVHADPEDAYVRVHGKGNKWREVGLGNTSRQELTSYLHQYRQGAARQDVLFVNCYGADLTPNGLLQIIYRLGEWADIEGVRCSPHTFRHTFACRYLLGGGDVYVLSRLMGHTSVQVTENYLKAVKSQQARKQSKSVLDNL